MVFLLKFEVKRRERDEAFGVNIPQEPLAMNDGIKEGARRLVLAFAALVLISIGYRAVTRTEGDIFYMLMRWPSFLVMFLVVPLFLLILLDPPVL